MCTIVPELRQEAKGKSEDGDWSTEDSESWKENRDKGHGKETGERRGGSGRHSVGGIRKEAGD